LAPLPALLAEPPLALWPLPFTFFPFDFFASILILLVIETRNCKLGFKNLVAAYNENLKSGHGVPCPYDSN
jgi:hypothetical protein